MRRSTSCQGSLQLLVMEWLSSISNLTIYSCNSRYRERGVLGGSCSSFWCFKAPAEDFISCCQRGRFKMEDDEFEAAGVEEWRVLMLQSEGLRCCEMHTWEVWLGLQVWDLSAICGLWICLCVELDEAEAYWKKGREMRESEVAYRMR